MSTVTFARSASVGFVIAVLAAGALVVLKPMVGFAASAKMATAAAAAGYGLFLLLSSETSTGRVVTPAIWSVLSIVSFPFTDAMTFALGQAASIWLVRSMYQHDGILPALADAALTVCSIGMAAWALSSGSAFLAIWAFFLTQSLAVWIPSLRRRTPIDAGADFEEAAARGRSAFEQMITTRSNP